MFSWRKQAPQSVKEAGWTMRDIRLFVKTEIDFLAMILKLIAQFYGKGKTTPSAFILVPCEPLLRFLQQKIMTRFMELRHPLRNLPFSHLSQRWKAIELLL